MMASHNNSWWRNALLRQHGCCCCLGLRTGSVAIAIVTLLYGLVGLGGFVAHLARDAGVAVSWVIVFNAINAIVVAVSGALLLFGSLTRHLWSVRLYLPLSVYTLFTFVFWFFVAVICAILSFAGHVHGVLDFMGGLSEDPAGLIRFEKSLSLEREGRSSTIRFASDDDTAKIMGFAFCAVAVVLIVYIAFAVNFLSVTFTFHEKLRMSAKKVSSMEEVIAGREVEGDDRSDFY